MDSIRLLSSDGHEFEVEKKVFCESDTIIKTLQLRLKTKDNSPLVLNNIDGKTLKKVIEYCERHDVVEYETLGDEPFLSDLNAFDANFVNVDRTTFFALHQAACYLRIKPLTDLTCGTLLKKFKGKNYKETVEVIKNWN